MPSAHSLAAVIQAHVPLKPVWLHVLLSIASGERHGYAIRKSVHERTRGKVKLWPTTLYGTLRQLEEARLIAADTAAEHDADGRGTRAFKLTDGGRAVLEAETRRLEDLVAIARSTAALAGR